MEIKGHRSERKRLGGRGVADISSRAAERTENALCAEIGSTADRSQGVLRYRTDKTQARLQFERRKMISPAGEGAEELILTEIQHLGKYATARIYGEGDRPGGVLASLIRPYWDKNAIMTIEAEGGGEIEDSELIAARFRDYYQSLYTSKVDPDPVALLDYLTHITMPQLTDTDREAFMAPLTLSEMAKALGGNG
ncbi:hypothetical protein NDU88_006247 [Pleurodeles waltl]|uniref:Uncharacterized protein n=1 Tax=Pleurodeles waltl TaxID=8319 RepID=A0AAV7N0D9_PLEWA|nr:hypothetical protein NDU88_006247 [Pleurodeles waltl]